VLIFATYVKNCVATSTYILVGGLLIVMIMPVASSSLLVSLEPTIVLQESTNWSAIRVTNVECRVPIDCTMDYEDRENGNPSHQG